MDMNRNTGKMPLPAYVETALAQLTACGHEAYAVGGCVRDMLMGRAPHDWDVCTSAAPDAVGRCFQDRRVLETGIQHGTVTVLFDRDEAGISCEIPFMERNLRLRATVQIEITTYRVDGAYGDHRRPDSVAFTGSLREDLARRDFTINAMAYRPDTGVVDYFGGREDLMAGVIRCVGEPAKRFAEDALRILRALRFASRFGFRLDEATADALLRDRASLRYVAAERVLAELCGMDFARIDPRFLPVLRAVIPELDTLPPQPVLPEVPALRLATLLRGLDAEAILTRLKASRALTARVAMLAREVGATVPAEDVAVRRLLRRIGPEAAAQLMVVQENPEAARVLDAVLTRGDCYSLKTLAVGGADMVALGYGGQAVGEALESLLDRVVEGILPNEKGALLEAARGR